MPRLSKIGAAALAAFGWTGLNTVSASYLQVAGGGGGASLAGGGGGAGGLLTGTTSLDLTLSYTVTVGAGGSGIPTGGTANGTNGSNSQFGTLTASVGGGGGGGATGDQNGSSGGSGGGARAKTPQASGGAGTSGQGNNGGAGLDSAPNYGSGGGGGAGAVGSAGTSTTGGNGGAGTASSITGTSVTYAGGGGGGVYDGGTAGSGGSGGGGAAGTGSSSTANNGTSGTANLGGGGGAGNQVSSPATSGIGGNGGSGVVIISYPSPQKFGGGVVTSNGGNTIHTFTTSGTLSPLSSLTASTLVVAGGGGGGNAAGGGGGAGGYQTGSGITLDTNSIYLVTVGAGGNGASNTSGNVRGNNGSDSAFNAITSTGGGAGGCSQSASSPPTPSVKDGTNGGSGGGSSNGGSIGSGNTPSTSPSQGNNGGSSVTTGVVGAGGGGGANAVGANGTASVGGNGGGGTSSSISGASVTYAGGGGGGSLGGTAGTGGAGGGGNGTNSNTNGSNGSSNTGGGGGGNGSSSGSPPFGAGGNGGSGIVIISYPGSTQQMAGGTVTVAGGNVIHTFTSSGYLTPIVLVNNSLRFRSSASAYLNRTPTVASNRQTWTWSAWVKRGALGATQFLFDATAGVGTRLYFTSGDVLQFDTGGSGVFTTSQVFRDPSAWYHIVFVADTTQATASNRIKLYINGTQVTAFSATSYPAQNTSTDWNNTVAHYLGRNGNASVSYLDGYLTEINSIDGQALTPNSFGTTSDLGVWQPIRYGGSYGTNGFYLPFPNSGAVTVNYLVVAGGGGGDVGGGGAGGLRSTVTNTGGGGSLESALTLNAGNSYTVTVGAGGAQVAAGNDSVFSTITSTKGGAGRNGTPQTGGSGGGGWNNLSNGSGTANQGYAGGTSTANAGGGGGGAGSVGANTTSSSSGGNGGSGVASSITGSSVTYAGGGGGGAQSGSGGTASDGGGAGSTSQGTAGTANTGGGGGGGFSVGAGAGGSGVVIVSYSGTPKFTGGVVSQVGGNTIHTFTSSGTLAGIGSDYSPNGNNWTPNGFSFSSGSTYDSMTDVPTLTSATVANYAVFNPLAKGANVTLSEGNLKYSTSSVSGVNGIVSMRISTGMKSYFEFTCGSVSLYRNISIGGVTYAGDSGSISGGTGGTGTFATWTTGDVVRFACDYNAGTIACYKNATLQTTVTGVTNTSEWEINAAQSTSTTGEYTANFGQQPFAYSVPTGFSGLNTFNLPTPTIGATAATTANKYMNIALYTGTGSSQSITGLGFQPDWTWIKERNAAADHGLYDAVRGVQIQLESNNTGAETTETTGLTAFGSDGFTVGALAQLNTSADTYVAWNWKANGAGSSNTDGTITSTVSANTTAGFSIVTYTGNATSAQTVGHGLGVTPTFFILKSRGIQVWNVYSLAGGITGNTILQLNDTDAAVTGSNISLTASSTTIGFGSAAQVNGSGVNFVAYCFAPVAGYSAMGSYTGNGSSDGPFIYFGFRPAFIIIKRTDAVTNWGVFDNKRSGYNPKNDLLYPNSTAAEDSGLTYPSDFVSNGYKIRDTSFNASGGTYIYMAFAENPFKYANAR